MSTAIKLSNGVLIPLVGLGTWQSPPSETVSAVEAAIDAGYRHIDTAAIYENETAVGEGIERKIQSGSIRRQDLFVCTKLRTTCHARNDVLRSAKESLQKLKLENVDLLLVHFPCDFDSGGSILGNLKIFLRAYYHSFRHKLGYGTLDYIDTWKGMEDVYRAGLAKAIGISNYNRQQIQNVLNAAEIKPHMVQVECHAYWPQKDLHDFCRSQGVGFTAYAPLGSPGAATYAAGSGPAKPRPMDDLAVIELANKHQKSPSQILLRWLIQRGIAVIPKSTNPGRIRENIDLFDFALSPEDVEKLDLLGKSDRIFKFEFIKRHPNYPFS